MSDSTRLVYDLVQARENKNITGLLMLIDFEKVFNSLMLWSSLDMVNMVCNK